MLDTLEQVRTQEPLPPWHCSPNCPAIWKRFVSNVCRRKSANATPRTAALAEDPRRYLAGEPILARPVGRAERAWRWCRRQPATAAALALVATLVLTAVGTAFWCFQERAGRQAEQHTEIEKNKALAEQSIRESVEQAKSVRADLYQTLRRPAERSS